MSTTATVRLLGPPTIQFDGNPRVEPLSAGSARLLAFLLLEGRDHSRERLATILWSDLSRDEGRTRLRNCIHRLKAVVGDEAVTATRERIGINPQWKVKTDVWDIARTVKQVQAHHPYEPEPCDDCAELLHRLQRYDQLPLLEGCLGADSTEFDDWLVVTESAIQGSIEWASQWLEEASRQPMVPSRDPTLYVANANGLLPSANGRSDRVLSRPAAIPRRQRRSLKATVPFVIAALATIGLGFLLWDLVPQRPGPSEQTSAPVGEKETSPDVAPANGGPVDSDVDLRGLDIASFAIPVENAAPDGLTWDGSSFWIVAAHGSRLLKVSPTGNLISSFAGPPGALSGIAFDGNHLWVGTYNNTGGEDGTNGLYKVDPEDGTVLSFINCPHGDLTGVAWDGEAFWYADWTEPGRIRRVSSRGELLQSFASPTGAPAGMTYIQSAQQLYSVDADRDELCLLGPDGATLGRWPLPTAQPMGLTHDGTYFWVVGRQPDRVYRVSLSTGVPGEGSVHGAPLANKPVLAPANEEPVVPAARVPPPVVLAPVVGVKDYSMPSYELQKTNLYVERGLGMLPFGTASFAFAYADFDLDGDEDILYGLTRLEAGIRTEMLLLLNNGQNVFERRPDFFVGGVPDMEEPAEAMVGDFNGDGRPDVILTDAGQSTYPIAIYSTSQGLRYEPVLEEIVGLHRNASSADIDGDGDLDLVFGSGPAFFLFNDGEGHFEHNGRAAPPGLWGGLVELVDVDGDGYVDVLYGEGHSVYWGDGTGSYADSRPISLPQVDDFGIILDMDSEDLDGDGDRDIIATCTGSGPDNGWAGFNLQYLRNNGDRTFTDVSSAKMTKYQARYEGNFDHTRLQDIDGDGDIDLFADDRSRRLVWLNDGTGVLERLECTDCW